MGKRLGADAVVNIRNDDAVTAVQRITGGKGVQYSVSNAPARLMR